jgi:tRNA nucleotidyltransferase (CCA-adding enzyme)
LTLFSPPKYVVSVLNRLECKGFSAYLVGGCVRDLLIGRRPADWDVCTNALPCEIMSVFEHSRDTGSKHGTVTVFVGKSKVEVTTFRSDGEYTDYRRPESVTFIPDLKGDLARRDFTMNAIALPLSGLAFDPFGGAVDIENRLIRCVGEPNQRFNEDALRMLRALRFSAVLGFEIEESTLEAIGENSLLTNFLAAERVCSELQSVLMSSKPELISQMISLGLLTRYIKDTQEIDLAALAALPKSRAERWAGLCALLLQSKMISNPEDFLQSLRLDSSTVHKAACGVKLSLSEPPSSKLMWKKLLSRHGTDCGKCTAAAADALYGTEHTKKLRSVISSGECYCLKRLKISGDELLELGFRGKRLGEVLYELLDHVLAHPNDNDLEVLLSLATDIAKSDGL